MDLGGVSHPSAGPQCGRRERERGPLEHNHGSDLPQPRRQDPRAELVASLGVDDVTALAEPTSTETGSWMGDDCTLVPNPAQSDADHDGFGNACDPDFDENGVVNFGDLARMKSAFFGNDPIVDLTGTTSSTSPTWRS